MSMFVRMGARCHGEWWITHIGVLRSMAGLGEGLLHFSKIVNQGQVLDTINQVPFTFRKIFILRKRHLVLDKR